MFAFTTEFGKLFQIFTTRAENMDKMLITTASSVSPGVEWKIRW